MLVLRNHVTGFPAVEAVIPAITAQADVVPSLAEAAVAIAMAGLFLAVALLAKVTDHELNVGWMHGRLKFRESENGSSRLLATAPS
jgi:hypothetical protein